MKNGSSHLESNWDVIVMGGGPAGACVSTLLAQYGRKVLLLERENFPRHHIGESLIPDTFWPLKRMGVIEKLHASGATRKFSVQFYTPDGRSSRPFYFFETNQHESAVTWQVDRAEFDTIMLNHAREQGVTAIEGARVTEVLFEGEQAVGVEAEIAGARKRFSAKVIVDATGLSAILGTKFGIRSRDPKLKKGVVYSYWKNAYREPGIDGGATLVIKTKGGNGWFWWIPQKNDVTSIGIVADPDYLFEGRGKDYEKILMEEIEKTEVVKDRIKDAERVDIVRTIADYSYRSSKCAGPGWVLVGDAFGFLDPIYSTGLYLALSGGAKAADAIEGALRTGDFSAERLGSWSEWQSKGMETFRKLVYAYYTEGFSFGKFLMKYPEYRANIIDVLTGNVHRPGIDDIYGPMAEYVDIPEPLAGPKNAPAGEAKSKTEKKPAAAMAGR